MHRDLLDRSGSLSADHFLRLADTVTDLCEGMRLVLESPTTTHSRHYVTRWGLQEHVRVSTMKREYNYGQINDALSRLSAATRDAPAEDGGGGSTLASFNRDLVARWQDLRRGRPSPPPR